MFGMKIYVYQVPNTSLNNTELGVIKGVELSCSLIDAGMRTSSLDVHTIADFSINCC